MNELLGKTTQLQMMKVGPKGLGFRWVKGLCHVHCQIKPEMDIKEVVKFIQNYFNKGKETQYRNGVPFQIQER